MSDEPGNEARRLTVEHGQSGEKRRLKDCWRSCFRTRVGGKIFSLPWVGLRVVNLNGQLAQR